MQGLEGEIERHHFGQRRRIVQIVLIGAFKDLTGLHINDEACLACLSQSESAHQENRRERGGKEPGCRLGHQCCCLYRLDGGVSHSL